MKINKSFIRIALAVGLIGLAACSGSDSSSSRQKNSALATNASHIEGTLLVPNRAGGQLIANDEYKISLDVNYQAKGSGDNTNYVLSNAFSNFQLSPITVSQGSKDFSQTTWSTCPVDAHLGVYRDETDLTAVNFLSLRFQETTAALGCDVKPSTKKASIQIMVMSTGPTMAHVEDNAVVSLQDLQLDKIFSDTENYYVSPLVEYPTDTDSDWKGSLVFSSTKISDYQPSALTATSSAAGIAVGWTRSADLTAQDQLGYNIEWSTDEFVTISGNLTITDNVEQATIDSCLITRGIATLQNTTNLYLRLTPKIADTDKAEPISVQVTRANGDFQCSVDKPAAPTNVSAKISADGNSVEVSWDAVTIADSQVEYCVFQQDPSQTDGPEFFNVGCSDTSPLVVDYSTNFLLGNGKATYVVATSNLTLHSISDGSAPITIDTPTTPVITEISSSLTDDGSLLFRWKPLSSSLSAEFAEIELFETILFFDVNRDIPCSADLSPAEFMTGMSSFMKANAVDQAWVIDHLRIIRSIDGGQIFSPEALGSEFKPGSTVNICMLRLGPWGVSKLTPASFTYPAASGVATAPVVDDTAKAAIVDATATEVQLPAADVEVAVDLTELLKGFSVAASDVSTVEYQVADGSWVALSKGDALKIPKSAAKLSVRVTKKNGEKVVSEKALVHAEASTDTTMAPADTTAASADTTMAPADTTAPVTTEAPASSDSSSSNNTVLYILGFVIVAGAVVMILKKKSASAPK